MCVVRSRAQLLSGRAENNNQQTEAAATAMAMELLISNEIFIAISSVSYVWKAYEM